MGQGNCNCRLNSCTNTKRERESENARERQSEWALQRQAHDCVCYNIIKLFSLAACNDVSRQPATTMAAANTSTTIAAAAAVTTSITTTNATATTTAGTTYEHGVSTIVNDSQSVWIRFVSPALVHSFVTVFPVSLQLTLALTLSLSLAPSLFVSLSQSLTHLPAVSLLRLMLFCSRILLLNATRHSTHVCVCVLSVCVCWVCVCAWCVCVFRVYLWCMVHLAFQAEQTPKRLSKVLTSQTNKKEKHTHNTHTHTHTENTLKLYWVMHKYLLKFVIL